MKNVLERENMAFIRGIIGSKKLGAVIAGFLTIILREALGLDEQTVQAVVALIMSYLIGQSGVDLALALKGSKTK